MILAKIEVIHTPQFMKNLFDGKKYLPSPVLPAHVPASVTVVGVFDIFVQQIMLLTIYLANS